jgi:hypothetical protein
VPQPQYERQQVQGGHQLNCRQEGAGRDGSREVMGAGIKEVSKM